MALQSSLPLIDQLRDVDSRLNLLRPHGGRAHELANIRTMVIGRLELLRLNPAKMNDPDWKKRAQEAIDSAWEFMANFEGRTERSDHLITEAVTDMMSGKAVDVDRLLKGARDWDLAKRVMEEIDLKLATEGWSQFFTENEGKVRAKCWQVSGVLVPGGERPMLEERLKRAVDEAEILRWKSVDGGIGALLDEMAMSGKAVLRLVSSVGGQKSGDFVKSLVQYVHRIELMNNYSLLNIEQED